VDAELTSAGLAELAQSTPRRIEELTRLGLITGRDARYVPGDVHRVRLIEAFAAAGVPPKALARANSGGAISLSYYDQLHQPPRGSSSRTYAQVLGTLGDRAANLRRLLDAFGVAEPEPGDRFAADVEQLLLNVLEALEANRDPDLALRAFRLYGDFARQGSEAAMSVYAEAVERANPELAGVPPGDVYERFLAPWGSLARLVPALNAWLHSQHLSAAIDAWSVEETERQLAESGFIPVRDIEPPAVAFVDLTAFTRLTEERGDRTAASVAMSFADRARAVAERRGGRLVKQLGDGVLLRFPQRVAAAEGALDLLAHLGRDGLPEGHAGIEAGPLVVREGDVFGGTVNRASRIADQAGPGELLAPASLAERLPDELRWEPVGVVTLQGVSEPVHLVRVTRMDAES
jgi:class 3 adenylate cyclase